MDIPRLLECIRESFNKRSQNDPVFRKSLVGFDRIISFSLTDDTDYFMSVVNGQVPAIQKGKPRSANIKIITDKNNLIYVLTGQLDPMKAMLSGKVKVSASLIDIAWLKKLIDNNKKEIAELVRQSE
jgi:putative sterol carrier protein